MNGGNYMCKIQSTGKNLATFARRMQSQKDKMCMVEAGDQEYVIKI